MPVDFAHQTLRRFTTTEWNLQESDFSGADLQLVNLSGATLFNAKFGNLQNVDRLILIGCAGLREIEGNGNISQQLESYAPYIIKTAQDLQQRLESFTPSELDWLHESLQQSLTLLQAQLPLESIAGSANTLAFRRAELEKATTLLKQKISPTQFKDRGLGAA